MGNGISFEASDLAGAVALGQRIVTAYGFSPSNSLAFGVIATVSFKYSGFRDEERLGVRPVLTFPVAVPGGPTGATTTSVVTCTTFNDGALPTDRAVTNQLTCAIPNTSIAPGTVTIGFQRPDGQPLGAGGFGTTYVFSVGSTSTVTVSTTTATDTVFVDGSTVGSTTVTDTTYLATVNDTPTTTLTGASSTTYVSCSPISSSTTTGTATASPGTTVTGSSNTTSGTKATAGDSSSTSTGTASTAPELSTGTAAPSTTASISSSPASPEPYPSSSTTSCTTNKPAPTNMTKVIKTITKTACSSGNAKTAALYARQATSTDVLASGFGGPDITFTSGNPVVSTIATSTSFVTESTVVTSGTDSVVVTSPVTTSTVTTTTVTKDERTVSTVSGCPPRETITV
ncbi:unnamed protein product [Zymoseptoria tritici ST99CH_1A5]|uniref:Uncharacterized protein n=2 Tax=Zymoseptoria tritici TaxID=1047171 RepID=A0A2H1GFX3_ZYMTR|nr:unnamed protein product [Zymoseptoria tritici ST99CH_1E4]SMR53660.1 unnamed protein product [Zymoseptoria tritici ST99CH_3D1]SMY24298.1 unnamed protein product [Zymoseptoria tritici ST99CH_1A5]